MTKDSLYYLSKEQVQQILTHANNIFQHVKVDITKVFSKEQLSRENEVRRLHYALLHSSDSTKIKSLKYGLIIGTRLTTQPLLTSLRCLSMLLSRQDENPIVLRT